MVDVGFTPPLVTNAAVDDEQVLHVVAAAPFVHHGPFRISAMRAVPSRCQPLLGTCSRKTVWAPAACQDLLGAGVGVLQHLPAVLADRVVDPGRRDTVESFSTRSSVTRLCSSGRSSQMPAR